MVEYSEVHVRVISESSFIPNLVNAVLTCSLKDVAIDVLGLTPQVVVVINVS